MTRSQAVERTCVAGLVCGLVVGVGAAATADQDPGSVAPAQAEAGQSARAKAQTKIDARLRAAIERLRDKQTGIDARTRAGALDLDESGRALVDIEARVSAELRSAIEAAGGLVVSEFPQYKAMRARVPLARIESLAERPDVQFIRTAEQAVTNPSGAVR